MIHRKIADTHVYFVATRQGKKKLLACNIAQGRLGVTAPVFWGVKETLKKKSFNVFSKNRQNKISQSTLPPHRLTLLIIRGQRCFN